MASSARSTNYTRRSGVYAQAVCRDSLSSSVCSGGSFRADTGGQLLQMIARIWRGAVRAADAAAYAAYVQRTGIEGYQGTPGNRGAWLLRRIEGDRAEFITVSFWESREAIEAFAGPDIDTAVFYPDDDQFLIERDLTVNHYEVAGTE
jgi:heme-degrading monooxygenase HmoA